MAQPKIQTSFNSGEWASALNARVDLAKYHSGAALLRNFFVDYRGGATARGGTKYILQTFKQTAVRLIPFQASFTVSYILEFGDLYLRFFNNGVPLLNTALNITAINQNNPCTITVANTALAVGDWVYATDIGGMTQLNDEYYIITARTATDITIAYLDGTAVDSSAFTAYTSGGTVAEVTTTTTPYTASELADIKFAQNVADLILCHPNHPPYKLTLSTANPPNWTFDPITFGATISAPTAGGVNFAPAGPTGFYYAYRHTAVDANGQESAPSSYNTVSNVGDIRTTAGSLTCDIGVVSGAVSYNTYRAEIRRDAAVPSGAAFGFVGNTTANTFIDSNIEPDYSQSMPIVRNPFSGSGVTNVTLTNSGTPGWTSVPTVVFTAAPVGGTTATAAATLQCVGVTVVNAGGGYAVGDIVVCGSGVSVSVTAVGAFGEITAVNLRTSGIISSGAVPSNPVVTSTNNFGFNATVNLDWNVGTVSLTNAGTGYLLTPSITFSGGGGSGATATATLGASSAGNPTVPGFFQQRLVLAGPVGNPQQFNMSQPGAYYNFNVFDPLLPESAFQGTIVSGQLNSIQSLISQPQGLIVLTDKLAWLINGGSPGSAISATDAVANAQVFSGASPLPPINAVDDILYVQSKGSIVRDLVFNYNKQVYTGTDISVMSSHLFYGYTLLEWAWAEEPFKVVKAVRNDGTMLNLTFLKEQELIAWTHSDTQGLYKSIATVTESAEVGSVDAVYTIVQRTINSVDVQYIERDAELYYPNGVSDAWMVDCGIQYSGAAATSFSGARHLAGMSVTGLADGEVITAFTMPANGSFTLATAASVVTIGLAYTPQLQTLAIDLGEPTVQGKMKKINGVTLRVNQTLGLQIGSDFDNLVDVEDLVVGNIGKDTNEEVTDLVTGDAYQTIDPSWTVPGQYCIQQSLPYPASILGVIPQITVGDTKDTRG